MDRVGIWLAALWACVGVLYAVPAQPANLSLPLVADVEMQPLAAQIKRLLEVLDNIGQPLLSGSERESLLQACQATPKGSALASREADDRDAVVAIQKLLDVHCLVGVQIDPESRMKVSQGPASPQLVEQGWRTFLIKVQNQPGVTAELNVESVNAYRPYRRSSDRDPKTMITPADICDRWLDLNMYNERPMVKPLSGLVLEYRVLQVFSRDAGDHEAILSFKAGAAQAEAPILFHVKPSTKVKFHVLDEDGKPTIGRFTIHDQQGRVYPSQAKRLAPDFFFHPQVYRADGESVTLPEGQYQVEYTHGPEYQTLTKEWVVSGDKSEITETFEMRRWINLSKMGWFSGDHHLHAAGCNHYSDPQQGVTPPDMMRHILGEDLDVGCVLAWATCWKFQKQFFEGKVNSLSTPDHLMRYDVEVAGFPSEYCGHLCLIGLHEDDYPGTTTTDEWPSWDLPILQWARKQGAMVGFSHSGWGLHTKASELPNMEIPPFDSIGANEYIVDVTHGVVDFISAGDTPWPHELNIWYHTNNAGFRTRISGETDFPCIYGERVGLSRGYVRLEGPLNFDSWMAAIKAGRSYISEGRAHLIDFQVNDRAVGTNESQLDLLGPQHVTVKLKAAALLDEKVHSDAHSRPIAATPYWDLERARVGDSRRVPVEVVVNGISVGRQEIEADGKVRDLQFDIDIQRSSWVIARIFAGAHTNPVYVVVGGKPIRPSRKSVQWCLDCVEQCWKQKSGKRLRNTERAACQAAYDHAREVYKKLLAECETD